MVEENCQGKYLPPVQLSLRFCSVCGANDRYRNLKLGGYHFGRDGKRCPGTVEPVAYEITDQERDQLDQQVRELLSAVEEHRSLWDGGLPVRNEVLRKVWDDDQKLYATAQRIREEREGNE